MGETREIENTSRGPTFVFVTILAEVSIKNHRENKTTEYTNTEFPLPHPLNIMYCVRVSLRTGKIIPCATLKRWRSWVISIYLWERRLSPKDDNKIFVGLFQYIPS
jgi:hypothetical protein